MKDKRMLSMIIISVVVVIVFIIIMVIISSVSGKRLSYEKVEDKLILSNCGELTFMHLKNQNILDGVKEIYLPLKDTNHSSVASLGSLLTYCYFVLQNPLYICTEQEEVKEHMNSLIRLYGTPKESIEFKSGIPSDIFTPEQTGKKEKRKHVGEK